jgi:hypothetical protein
LFQKKKIKNEDYEKIYVSDARAADYSSHGRMGTGVQL